MSDINKTLRSIRIATGASFSRFDNADNTFSIHPVDREVPVEIFIKKLLSNHRVNARVTKNSEVVIIGFSSGSFDDSLEFCDDEKLHQLYTYFKSGFDQRKYIER